MTIDCPLDCPYLVAAHRYEAERPADKRPREMAFPDVVVEQEFLEERQGLLAGLSVVLLRAAREQPDTRDPDALAALDALVRSYQTLESGLYYEQTPDTPAAQAVAAALRAYLEQFSREQQQRLGASLRPGEALRALVFLRRLGDLEANGRPLSRRYLEFLRAQLPADAIAPEPPRLIIPGS
ncbi:MAG: hypothetical protein HYY26_00720 [Acidobacteria bacterium]|nr:hypothetical protein [Acidobacteriota bacterium]